MSAPEQSNVDVTLGKTGFNPYRTSQFEDTDLWVKAGMSKEGADNYLGAIRESLQSPNMILDLRSPSRPSTRAWSSTRRWPSSWPGS